MSVIKILTEKKKPTKHENMIMAHISDRCPQLHAYHGVACLATCWTLKS